MINTVQRVAYNTKQTVFFYFIEITLGADLTPTVYQAWKDGVWGDWETTNNYNKHKN